MNKFISVCFFLLIAGHAEFASAQSSINKLSETIDIGASPRSIEGLSAEPKTRLQSSENGETKPTQIENGAYQKNIIEAVMEKSSSVIEKLTALQFKYALLLNVNVESMKNLSLLGLIDNWFGTRYKMGGNDKSGIDCSAFTSTLLSTIYGLILPRTALEQYRATTHITKNKLKEGDLVFFHIHHGVSHVGLYLANKYFVHASSSQGVTISNLDDEYYSKRFICGGRAAVN